MSILKTKPAVFAVDNKYQIMVPVNGSSLMWVEVGNKKYFDHSNGIIRSEVDLHKIEVPAHELDAAGEYTICWRKVIERKAYYSKTEDIESVTYKFYPVPQRSAKAYHIADAHGFIDQSVAAAKTFEKVAGEIDFLILNGDITDANDKPEDFDNIYEIAAILTRGEKPVVFSRGNHDMRGLFAEKFELFTPSIAGRTYYTFRLGSIWGLVLDCGEDKVDICDEYGNTICCEPFRREETEFIKEIISNAKNHYEADGVKHKCIISHFTFTRKHKPPFDIEKQLYKQWAEIIKENIAPDVMICGHEHSLEFALPGDESDNHGHPCPLIVGSELKRETKYFAGAGFVFGEKIQVIYTDSNGKVVMEKTI